jgi:hypothetical protein
LAILAGVSVGWKIFSDQFFRLLVGSNVQNIFTLPTSAATLHAKVA